jgi:PAS domain S-box-containing protein
VRWSAEVEAIRGNVSGEGFEGSLIELRELIHPEDRDPLQLAVTRNLQAGAPGLDAECRVPIEHRGIVWLKLKGQVIRNAKGMPERVTGVVWDTTKQKVTEEELRRANEIKDEFLGMVSHELRTPTTTLYSGARLLLNRYDELDDETKQSVLRDVEHEAQRLELIIENLLALARQEDGHAPEPEPISVWRTTESVVTRMRRLRPRRKFELQREGESDLASGVPIYLELVLRNVLDNADKYSPASKPIEVRAGAMNGNIVLTVRDHGPGIPEDETEKVFDRFYRSAKVDRNTSGAGIGLSVCRRLLESHGATIEARRAGGGGTELVIALPRYMDD